MSASSTISLNFLKFEAKIKKSNDDIFKLINFWWPLNSKHYMRRLDASDSSFDVVRDPIIPGGLSWSNNPGWFIIVSFRSSVRAGDRASVVPVTLFALRLRIRRRLAMNNHTPIPNAILNKRLKLIDIQTDRMASK